MLLPLLLLLFVAAADDDDMHRILRRRITRDRFHQHFPRSFYTHRSQKGQKYIQSVSLFCAFRSVCLKALRKMLVKLTSDQKLIVF